MSSIMGQIRPDWFELSPLKLEKSATLKLVYTLASTNKNSYDNKIFDEFYYGSYSTQTTWASYPLIRAAVFDLVYTSAPICVSDANLTIFLFESKRLIAMIHCIRHHLMDLYKFCTHDAPRIITGPALQLRHLYIDIN